MNEWAYGLLGFLMSLLFVLDGWRPPENPNAPFWKTPRLRGLLFVLGGGVIPIVQSTLADDPEAVTRYVQVFSVGTLLLIGLTGIYSMCVGPHDAQSRPQHPQRRKPRGVERLNALVLGLYFGPVRYLQEADRRVFRAVLMRRQNEIEAVEVLQRVIEEEVQTHGSVSPEKTCELFERVMGKVFLPLFAEQFPPQKYRIAVHVLDRDEGSFRFFAGARPAEYRFSGKLLSLEKSLAGHAIQNPGKVWWHPDDTNEGDENVPFEPDKLDPPFQSVAALAIPPVNSTEPWAVVSIDCVHSKIDRADGLIESTLRLTASLLALAWRMMGADPQTTLSVARRAQINPGST